MLKSEIDIAGGNNYVVMGSSQFMSVPYALYANEAGFAKKAGPATAAFHLPDGFENLTPVVIPANASYTVPAGKNIYISSATDQLKIDGHGLTISTSSPLADSRTMIGASAGSVLSVSSIKTAFLINKTVDWVTVDFHAVAYSIPAGKQLVVISQSFLYYDPNNPGNTNCFATLNGASLTGIHTNLTNTVLDEGTVLSTVGCPNTFPYAFVVNGYLKDK